MLGGFSLCPESGHPTPLFAKRAGRKAPARLTWRLGAREAEKAAKKQPSSCRVAVALQWRFSHCRVSVLRVGPHRRVHSRHLGAVRGLLWLCGRAVNCVECPEALSERWRAGLQCAFTVSVAGVGPVARGRAGRRRNGVGDGKGACRRPRGKEANEKASLRRPGATAARRSATVGGNGRGEHGGRRGRPGDAR